ncbi:hypothetical protein BH10BAC6_BH10BAC6_07200 [soil metagenome]
MRNMTRLPHLAAALFFVVAATAFAQGPNNQLMRPRIGLFFDYAVGVHAASFKQLPDVANCCPEFKTTLGSGFFAGLQYEQPFNKDLALHFRLHYGSFGVDFSQLESKPVALADGSTTSATIRHDLNGSFGQISVEPLLAYRVSPEFMVRGGLTAGYVFSATYDQKEVLQTPLNATFAGGTRVRNASSGDIKNASAVAVGITIGASYELALNSDRTIFLTPEVLFTYSPIPVVSGLSWNAHQIRAGLALSFIPPEVEDTLSDVELYNFAKAITPPKSVSASVPFTSDISATGIGATGERLSADRVRIEEFSSTRIRPVLPYVFFDKNSSEVPRRYTELNQDQRDVFAIENFYNLDAMITYHHLLNIIGKRMQEDANATITLTGCVDNTDVELNNTALAQSRVNAVRSYLVDKWGVASSRVQTATRLLPEQASNSSELDGQAENRRVEISTTSDALLAPVMSRDTMRSFTPAGLRFAPVVSPRVPVKSWTIFVTADDRIIKTFHAGDPVPASIDWRIDEAQMAIPADADHLGYLFVARDSAGLVIPSESKKIQVDAITLAKKKEGGMEDRVIDRYSLILFGFDKSDVSPVNTAFVNQIKSNIQPSSQVKVIGYTDRSGAEDYNQRLSQSRAASVARALGLPESQATGVGERVPLYNNDSPEGRFYSRTVEVLVETPKK